MRGDDFGEAAVPWFGRAEVPWFGEAEAAWADVANQMGK